MQEFEEIWQLILEELKKIYSDTTINLWFTDTKLRSLDENKAVIYVPSSFKCATLKSKHSEQTAKAMQAVLGYKVEPVFTDGSEETKREPVIREIKDISEKEEEAPQVIEIRPEQKEENKTTENKSNSSDYTFENFIVGSSNRFAHAASMAVAQKPAHAYNPLFIYGPSGLGKTHLLYAIINEIKKEHPKFNIIYVKGEEFTNQLIESLRYGNPSKFRERFRSADVLLIDDIHFIAGKEGIQEEFFHTFNDLYEHKKQIILTSDKPAKDIQKLEERLRTRFEWGLCADIQPPDFELRVAIMKNKANALGADFSREVLNYIAEKLTNNIRQIEGAIKKIIAYSQLNSVPVTVSLVNECLSDLFINSGKEKITPEKIINKVGLKYEVNPDDLCGKKKMSNISQARHICIYLIKKLLDMSTTSIGKLFNRDHTTIMHSLDVIEQQIKNDSALENEIKEIMEDLTSN